MAITVIGVLVIWDVKFRLCYQAVDFQWRRMDCWWPPSQCWISTMIRWFGNLCYPLVMSKELLKMAIYSGRSHSKWWFSIVMLIYRRVYVWSRLTDCFPMGCQYSPDKWRLKIESTSGKSVMFPKYRKSTENKHVDTKAELRYARTTYLAQRYACYRL